MGGNELVITCKHAHTNYCYMDVYSIHHTCTIIHNVDCKHFQCGCFELGMAVWLSPNKSSVVCYL